MTTNGTCECDCALLQTHLCVLMQKSFMKCFLEKVFNISVYFEPQFLEKFHGNAIHVRRFMLWETKSCYVYVKGRKLS
jgi:hypothetical protein